VSRLALERGFWLAAAREAAEAVQLAVAALEPSRAEGAVAPPDGRCPILGEAEARRAAERAEGLLALAAERAGKTI
jgi:hypothetical protein